MWRFSRRILRSRDASACIQHQHRHRAVDHSSARRVGFWTYFFLFCRRWKVPQALKLRDTPHPRQPGSVLFWFCYSESVFLMALLGFVYWSTAEGPTARALAAIQRDRNVRARIVGIVCAAFLWCGGFSNRMARFAQAPELGSREQGSHRADVCRGVRADPILRLLPTTMGPLGPLHAHAGGCWALCRLPCNV